jgi:hypothetical protein
MKFNAKNKEPLVVVSSATGKDRARAKEIQAEAASFE